MSKKCTCFLVLLAMLPVESLADAITVEAGDILVAANGLENKFNGVYRLRLTGNQLAASPIFIGTEHTPAFAYSVASDQFGNVFLNDSNENELFSISLATQSVSSFATNTGSNPRGIDVDDVGNVYGVVGAGRAQIVKYDASDGSRSVIADATDLLGEVASAESLDLVLHSNGKIYATIHSVRVSWSCSPPDSCIRSGFVWEFDPISGQSRELSGSGLFDVEVRGIGEDADGNLLVTQTHLSDILSVDPVTGAGVSVANLPPDTAGISFDDPIDVLTTFAGAIFVVDRDAGGLFYTVDRQTGNPYLLATCQTLGMASQCTNGMALYNGPTYTINAPISFATTITIDIKPGSDPNCFNVNGHGVIPVAVLGSESIDVSDIDQTTLSFGGADVRVRGNKGPYCGTEDVNSDGIYDIVCHFEDNPHYWEPGQDAATLSGALLDGVRIEGTDTICIVP